MAEKCDLCLWNQGSGGGGGGSSTLRVEQVYDESTGDIILRETWQTIYDALSEGIFVYISGSGEGHEYNSQELVISAYTENNSYKIKSAGAQYQTVNVYIYEAASPDDYPVS